jgi:hypothetical protein
LIQATFFSYAGRTRKTRRIGASCGARIEEKATLSRAVAEILDRLGSRVAQGHARPAKLRQSHLLGRFLASTRQRLGEVAERLGLRRVPNLGGCPAS